VRTAARHRPATWLLVIGLACAAVVAAGATTRAAAPAIRAQSRMTLVRAAPATVHGTAFRGHERVRVVLRRPGRAAAVREVTASAGGAFSVAFRGTAVDRCAGFSLSARGGFGSRAAMRRVPRPACPPA